MHRVFTGVFPAATRTLHPYATEMPDHVSYQLGHLVALTLILMTRDVLVALMVLLKLARGTKPSAGSEIFQKCPSLRIHASVQ